MRPWLSFRFEPQIRDWRVVGLWFTLTHQENENIGLFVVVENGSSRRKLPYMVFCWD